MNKTELTIRRHLEDFELRTGWSLIADERTVLANDLSISTGPSFFPGGSVDYYILDKVDYSTLI